MTDAESYEVLRHLLQNDCDIKLEPDSDEENMMEQEVLSDNGNDDLDSTLRSKKLPKKNLLTAYDTWSYIFSDSLLNLIVKYTNEALAIAGEKSAHIAACKYYIPTNKSELKAFFGLLYFSGVQNNERTTSDEMWSVEFGSNMYRATMALYRFQTLIAHLNFGSTKTTSENKEVDKLAPIREIFKQYGENRKKLYTSSQHHVINEQLLAYERLFGTKVVAGSLRQIVRKRKNLYDGICSSYFTFRKTTRWPMQFFFGMLDQASVDANVSYNFNREKLGRRDFLKQLALELVSPEMERRFHSPEVTQTSLKSVIQDILHIEGRLPEISGNKLEKTRRCAFCPKNKKARASAYCCLKCYRPVCSHHRAVLCVACHPL